MYEPSPVSPEPTPEIKPSHTKKIIIVAILALVLVLAGITIFLLIRKHQSDLVAAAQTKLLNQQAQVKALNQLSYNLVQADSDKFLNIANQDINLPSTTTLTNSEWDSQYDQEVSSINSIINDLASQTPANSSIQAYDKEVQKIARDFIVYVQAEKASMDLQFKVNSDQTTVNIDQNYLTSQQNIYNSLPFSSSATYVTQAKSQLASDQSILSADQTTQATSVKQENTAFNTYNQELVNISDLQQKAENSFK